MLTTLLAVTAVQNRIPVLDVPKRWPSALFGTESNPDSIDGRAKISELANLRLTLLPKGEEEVRIWIGFGLQPLEGFRFHRKGQEWSAWRIQSLPKDFETQKTKKFLEPVKPVQGWRDFWSQMDAQSFYSLPDFYELPGPKDIVVDGTTYVIEIQREGRYRTYTYDNPLIQSGSWKELENMKKIVDLLFDSFPYKSRN